MSEDVSYIDALKILGEGHDKTLENLGRIFGAAVLTATAFTGQIGLLELLGARDEVVKRSRSLLTRLAQRVRGASGKSRTDLLMAAHAIVAVNAFFVAFDDVELPIDLSRLELTAKDKLAIAGAQLEAESRKLADAVLQLSVPVPAPYRSFEQTCLLMLSWYQEMSQRALNFIAGLAVHDALDETKQAQLQYELARNLPAAAVKRYEEGFRSLAVECPDFHMWVYLTDSAASRAAIARLGGNLETGLAGLQKVLESLLVDQQSGEWSAQLASAYRDHLERPIADTSPTETLAGLVVPTLAEGYVNPRLRVAECNSDARPAEESWWSTAAECDDVQWFLAGFLTSPSASDVPLVVLGQPGSGKSLLTKVLAARLPPEEYLPVRVELRHVPPDAPIQDQIELALREATGERMDWPRLFRQAGDALAVVMLDGFDELLQATGVSHSAYLEQVREFQRREATQGRHVAVIVTSRIAVANRVRFPDGTVVAKMEPFDETQISQWLVAWNAANIGYFRQVSLQPLPVDVVLAQHDLAEQPLLLLMLSLYDANGNALQQQSDELSHADLYEGLLEMFVSRELDKRYRNLDQSERTNLVESHLDELSVVAFAMFNRGRKSVSEFDIDNDLTQLLGQDDTPGSSRMSLSRGQLAIGRFFFIHKSEATVDETRLNEYEFLHATFGEYLVARLIHKILVDLVENHKAIRPSLAVRSTSGAYDRVWDLLSFSPLTDGSQAGGFLAEKILGFNSEDTARLRVVLIGLFRKSLHVPAGRSSGRYEPRLLSVPARHAVYSANLLVLNVLAAENGSLRASDLFGSRDRPVESWRPYALLWKSQLDPAGWDALISSLNVEQHSGGEMGDLTITLVNIRLTKPLEHFRTVEWMTYGAASVEGTGVRADKTAWQAIFLCAPELDLLIHALQPLMQISSQAFREVRVNPDGDVQSAMHLALRALIDSADSIDSDRDAATRLARQYLSPSAVETLGLTNMISTGVDISSLAINESAYITPIFLKSPLPTSTAAITVPIVNNFYSPSIQPSSPDDAFAALKLYAAGYESTPKVLQKVPSLTIDAVYNDINPLALASEGASFVGSVLRLARDRGLHEWASRQGLVALAMLKTEELGNLAQEDVDFVLNASATHTADAAAVAFIRSQYERAIKATVAGVESGESRK